MEKPDQIDNILVWLPSAAILLLLLLLLDWTVYKEWYCTCYLMQNTFFVWLPVERANNGKSAGFVQSCLHRDTVRTAVVGLFPFFMALHSNTRESGLAAWWRLQPQNERCQPIKVHMSTGRSLVNNFSLCSNWYKSVVLSLIWLHSLVCPIHNKQMSQLVAYSGNICVWVVSCNECGDAQPA